MARLLRLGPRQVHHQAQPQRPQAELYPVRQQGIVAGDGRHKLSIGLKDMIGWIVHWTLLDLSATETKTPGRV
jgi:hypothetical protein